MIPILIPAALGLIGGYLSREPKKYHLGGDMSKHLAPNGQPSNLNPEQYKLVRTPEFKAWFGDWENDPENASKVVDENGEPLVVYHGSESFFNIFDINLEGKNYHVKRRKGKGIYFSNRKDVAESFIKKYDFLIDKHLGKLYECFLSFRGKTKIIDGEGQYIDHISHKIEKEDENTSIIVKDVYDSVNQSLGGDIYIAINPNQIKLADGTNTTFDPENPDIRYSDGGLIIEPNERIEWNGYKVGDIIEGTQLLELSGGNVGGEKRKKYILIQSPLYDYDFSRSDIYDNVDNDPEYMDSEDLRIDKMKKNFNKTPPIPYNGDGLHRIVSAKELGHKTILMWKEYNN
jgi:hypothetical protein